MDRPHYLQQLFSLEARTALVSGGYGYLGRHLSLALAKAGAHCLVAGPSRKRFEEAFPAKHPEIAPLLKPSEGSKQEGRLSFFELDLSQPEKFPEYLNALPNKQLDILVNNGFYSAAKHSPSTRQTAFSLQMDAFLTGTAELSQACLPYLEDSNQAAIINIASMYGIVSPRPSLYEQHPEFTSPLAYNAAKAGLIQLTRYWASFWAAKGIRVNAISPGPFPRPEVQKQETFIQKLNEQAPLGRIGQPSELQGALLLLASGAGSYITGANLVVDGGWCCQ